PRDRLGNAREKLARRELAFDAPGAFAFVFLVQINEIDVAAEVEFASAELSHAQDDESLRPPRDIERAKIALDGGAAEAIGDLQRSVRERRELSHRFFDGLRGGQVAGAVP